MIRRLNYTNRERIAAKDVRIFLLKDQAGFSFQADLSRLATQYKFRAGCAVHVEAYRQATWMRFAFGHTNAIRAPDDCSLRDFDVPEGILFRVKITSTSDHHKLVAEADRIPLTDPQDKESKRTPLLPVKPQDLPNEIFRVMFEGDSPILAINRDFVNWRELVTSTTFRSLAYPSIFRDILTRVLVVDRHDDEDASDDWRSQWVKMASSLSEMRELPPYEKTDQTNRLEWIDDAVAAFSKKLNVQKQLLDFWKDGESK